MTVAEYLAENEKWLGERISANISQIADEKWPVVVAGCKIINAGATDPGISCDVVLTHETISDFDSSRQAHWSERGVRSEIECDGHKAVLFENFQRSKGARRTSILVIDIDDKRVVLE